MLQAAPQEVPGLLASQRAGTHCRKGRMSVKGCSGGAGKCFTCSLQRFQFSCGDSVLRIPKLAFRYQLVVEMTGKKEVDWWGIRGKEKLGI